MSTRTILLPVLVQGFESRSRLRASSRIPQKTGFRTETHLVTRSAATDNGDLANLRESRESFRG